MTDTADYTELQKGTERMEIAIIADDKKKELLTQFCIAYCGILSSYNLCATGITGKYISEATGLKIERMLPGGDGGLQQISSRIACDEIDMLIFFRDTTPNYLSGMGEEDYAQTILRLCDLHNVPIATNIATAEVLVRALDRGDLDWREIVNPRSEYNLTKKQNLSNRR